MNTVTEPVFAASANLQPPSSALRRFAWGVLGCNVAVVLEGAAVRSTGSGAGCGDHWPLCNGTVVQHHPTLATLIEFTHRSISGIALIAVVALVFWVFRRTIKGHIARAAVVASLILILNEALLGALLVLLGKTAHDQSASRGVYLALHFTNTLLLLGALTLTGHFLSRRAGFMRGSVELRSSKVALTGVICLLFVGVAGSLAALGDTLFPATSLREALLQDFGQTAGHVSWLIRLRWIHPASSFIAGIFLLWLVANGLRTQANQRLSLSVIFLLGLQYALGVADVVLLTPTWMQILHLLGADLLWIAVVVLSARLCLRPIGCAANSCAA
ncbi:COX15/CtaA family protein [Silvibacterium acidisoli]|uniref:COX15/CtaA family protein n=1 Tax=Acidobacteriaceae bacterium ZG23-2 TaxID=2883246 RepID=UPI00406CBA53